MQGDLPIFVSTMIVPIGLMAIMFSMGLSLALSDFAEVAANPRAAIVGLTGQLLILPPIAIGISALFGLTPEMAVGLFILANCPGGVTANAITYVAKANVALGVVLTTVSSIITVFTLPLLVSWSLQYYIVDGTPPTLSIPETMLQLARVTLLPIAAGMALRQFWRAGAERLTIYLRPVSMILLITVIAFSVYVSADLVVENLRRSAPAAFTLNVTSIVVAVTLALLARLQRRDVLTIGIEVGIHNATMATFLSLSILHSLALAITPTIYGCIMVLNAFILVALLRDRRQGGASAEPDVAATPVTAQ
jgi:bile acid:Na+ symporter, BASS family